MTKRRVKGVTLIDDGVNTAALYNEGPDGFGPSSITVHLPRKVEP